MQYEKPTLEFWDLEEEEEIITTSLGSKPENGEGSDNDGDFDGDKVEWF